MIPKRFVRFVTALLLITILVAGCAQPTPVVQIQKETVKETVIVAGTPVEVTKEVVSTVVVQVTPTAAPKDQARAEQVNFALGSPVQDPTNLNIYAPSVSRSGTGLHQMIYEYFFYYNLQTGEFIPWLATDYKYNADFTALTVHLRKNVTWSDGKPFTSADVVFTYDTLRANPGMTWSAESSQWVKSVDAPDDYTVVFNLTSSNPRFHQIREAFPAVGIWGGITILPKHVWEGQDPLKFKSTDPIGTGAYKLVKATQNAMTYQRRDDWWGIKEFGVTPGPKIVNFEYIGTSTSVALALANSEIDSPFIGILTLSDFLAVKNRNPNLGAWYPDKPYAWLDPCPRALMVQNATPPWDKKEARWGLSYMINRQQITDLAYEGTTTPSWGIWPFYDGLKPYFDAVSDLRTQYPTDKYDAAKGAEMLTSAGLKKTGDAWTFNGKPVTVNYVVDSSSTEEMKVSQVLADQLTTAGFKVNVQPQQGSVLANNLLVGAYDIKLHSFCPGYIYDNLDLFNSKNYVPLGKPAPWYERNSFRYKNPDFDKVVNEMAKTSPDDQATMIKQYHDAMAIWFPDLPVIPMFQAPALVPFSSTYWTGWPDSKDPWNMPVSWWANLSNVIIGYPGKDGKWVGGLKPVQ